MEELFNRISGLMAQGEQIPLTNGNVYTYLNTTTTRINGELFPFVFQYRISGTQTKCVTVNLIRSMYQHHLNHGEIPSRSEMFDLFPRELCSRPCNYTVAVYIVNRLLNDDNNQ
ncbi:MAG: hypothetical protein FJX80_06735 [Bacteroidetes bacterium]|nr:hypothetical protein [Bacteroidota bacterium]